MWELFISFVKIGLCSFGGGYAALSLILNQVVTKHHWLALSDFADVVTISQMTPGPIVINAATFVGQQLGGLKGAIVASIGSIFPSLIIVSFLTYIYFRYKNLAWMKKTLSILQPIVIGMIAISAVSMIEGISFSWLVFLLFVMSLYLLQKKQMNQIGIIIGCGIVYALWFGLGL